MYVYGKDKIKKLILSNFYVQIMKFLNLLIN